MYPIVYLNGEFVPASDACLHVSDLAIQRGYGVFDYFRYENGRPRFFADHLDRFERSAELLQLDLPVSREQLRRLVSELIARNEVAAGGIRLILTGGYAADGYTPAQPNLVGIASAASPPPDRLYERGCRVITHRYARQSPRAKTIDYIEGIRIQGKLRQAEAHYVIYVDGEGRALESDRSNFMLVKNGIVITPRADILEGITRKHILVIARQIGIPVEERDVRAAELGSADELIICSSVKGVLPATVLDGKAVGSGSVGPVTKALMAAWPNYLEEYHLKAHGV